MSHFMRGGGLRGALVAPSLPLGFEDAQVERDIVPDDKLDVVGVERSLENGQRVLDRHAF